MTKPTIGFIGLGLMGSNMVENLQKKGFEPIVMDLNKDAVAAVVARGAKDEDARDLGAGALPRRLGRAVHPAHRGRAHLGAPAARRSVHRAGACLRIDPRGPRKLAFLEHGARRDLRRHGRIDPAGSGADAGCTGAAGAGLCVRSRNLVSSFFSQRKKEVHVFRGASSIPISTGVSPCNKVSKPSSNASSS